MLKAQYEKLVGDLFSAIVEVQKDEELLLHEFLFVVGEVIAIITILQTQDDPTITPEMRMALGSHLVDGYVSRFTSPN